MESEQVVTALAALAQPTRLAIFRLLVVCGPQGMAAGQLAEKLDVSPANMSFHFNKLCHAGLVVSRQDGRFVYYAANFAAMNGMLAFFDRKLLRGQCLCHAG